MPKSEWAEAADSVIRPIVNAYNGGSEKELRKLISDAYPFGERAMHPYKMWLKRVKVHIKDWEWRKRLESE